MLCRFENRRSGKALALEQLSHRIEAHAADELPAAFQAIQAAQSSGYWVALLLEYELGEWLDPALAHHSTVPPPSRPVTAPLTALVYRHARWTDCWPALPDEEPPALRSRMLPHRSIYAKNIQALKRGIALGEFYQVNYTVRLEIESTADPLALYRHIASRHPSAHAAYIEDGQRRILSFSPELFVAREGQKLTVRPMKGTAPRHSDPLLDRHSGEALRASEKNLAENLMIVDLLRNDLGRLAVPGSINVEALFTLEAYPSVWTLTSTIRAEAPDQSLEAILRALFPCGSITGAPKIAAMERIKSLEDSPRGIYCGSLGWLAPGGDFSLNVAIRTLEMHDQHTGLFGVGGGIVHDSDPDLEWQECLWKARILGSPDTSDHSACKETL